MEEGLHHLSEAHYRRLPGISQSFLNLMEECPAKARAGVFREKDGMRMGTLLHYALLEPAKLKEKLILQPDFGPLQSSKNRALRDAWILDQDPDAIIATEKEMGKITIMLDSVRRKKLRGAIAERLGATEVASLFQDSYQEITAIWNEAGERCKARLDNLHKDALFVLDVKKTKNASTSEFTRTIANLKYYRQAAWYLGGASKAMGRPIEDYLFLAIEEDSVLIDGRDVCGVNVLIADEGMLSCGEEEIMRLFQEYKARKERDDFPFYSDEIGLVGLPSWKLAQKGGSADG